MTTRDELIQALASASTLQEQMRLVGELDAFDQGRLQATAAERSLDWAATTVQETLAPVSAYDRHSGESDWLAETPTTSPEHYHQAVLAEASRWFQRCDQDVRADAYEYLEQAKGISQRTASKYVESYDQAYTTSLEYLAFLNREVLAASGLDQIQQTTDPSGANYKPTPLPTEVFDTFQPPVHPINQGVDGTQQNSLAPGAEMAMSENNGSPQGDPSHHDWTGTGVATAPDAGVIDGSSIEAPTHPGPTGDPSEHDYRQASLFDPPSVAIGYGGYTLNDFLAAEAAREEEGGHPFGEPPAGEGVNKEAASSLPQIQQTTAPDGITTAPTGMPDDVMFPIEQDWPEHTSAEFLQQGGQETGTSHRPHTGQRKQADQWHGGDDVPAVPGGETPVGNSPETSDPKVQGDYARGHQEGQQDARSGERPTFSDASSAVSPYVKGYTEGYGQGVPEPSTQPDVPYSMGGDAGQATNASEVAARTEEPLSMSAAYITEDQARQAYRDSMGKQADGVSQKKRDDAESKGHTLPGTDKFPINNKQDLENAKHDIGRTNEPHDKVVRYINERAEDLGAAKVGDTDKGTKKGGLTVSASMLSRDVSQDLDFQRGYRIASSWSERKGIPKLGSQGFEAGLYAGITDNPAQQYAWSRKHHRLAEAQSPIADAVMDRLENHREVTAHYVKLFPDTPVKGLYVQAATSTDLDTMSPQSTPDPQGATPIMGPGTPPPMAGAPGSPADSGGPSPYNGAEPLGSPVAPDPLIGQPAPQPPQPAAGVNMEGESGLTNATPKTLAGLNPQAIAFRKLVQHNKLALRQRKD